MKVTFGNKIKRQLLNFPSQDREKIFKFVTHVKQHGFDGLAGRNKSSADVCKDDPQFKAKLDLVRQFNLWHYHIGIPVYQASSKGDLVSEYVLHYIREIDHIKIVDLGSHPPFKLPLTEYLD